MPETWKEIPFSDEVVANPLTANLDFADYEAENLVLQNEPTVTQPTAKKGKAYFDITTGHVTVCTDDTP